MQAEDQAEYREILDRLKKTPGEGLRQVLEAARSMYGPRPAESRRRPLTDYRVTDEERAVIRARIDELARTEG
jgi:hypothetical protein